MMANTAFLSSLARFPDPWNAPSFDAPLAYGGDLKPLTLIAAYSLGFFPWFNEGDPIFWWHPDPRCVLFPDDFRISSRSLRKIRKSAFVITLDKAFDQVIRACAAPRGADAGTWITDDIIIAYEELFRQGYAHSVEAWQNGTLAGGVYGIALGNVFFGESMFHKASEAGRGALVALVQLLKQENFLFMDCQQESPHMLKMGAVSIPRKEFLSLLRQGVATFQTDDGILPWIWKNLRYDNQSGIWVKTT